MEAIQIFKKINYKSKRLSFRCYLTMSASPTLSKNHYLTFPPNFIHSIDAAVCRILIFNFYKQFNIILECLHDSFGVHPIFVVSLINLIKFIYITIFFPKKNNTVIYFNIISNSYTFKPEDSTLINSKPISKINFLTKADTKSILFSLLYKATILDESSKKDFFNLILNSLKVKNTKINHNILINQLIEAPFMFFY